MNAMLPVYMDHLKQTLGRKFAAQVEVEQVADHRYRFDIVSPSFEKMSHLTRQDELWKTVDEVLTREQVLEISLLLAYAPSEIEQ